MQNFNKRYACLACIKAQSSTTKKKKKNCWHTIDPKWKNLHQTMCIFMTQSDQICFEKFMKFESY